MSIEPALRENVIEEVFDEPFKLQSERAKKRRVRDSSESENEDGVSSSDSELMPIEREPNQR